MLCFVVLFAGFGAACGSAVTPANNTVTPEEKAAERFPFSLKEPETYQADAVLTTNGVEEKFFVARKAGKWRYDILRAGKPSITWLRGDNVYYVDHAKKAYCEMPTTGDTTIPGDGPETMRNLFRGRERFKFEEVGRSGTLIKYRAFSDAVEGDTFVYFDTAAAMITRQESPEFVYDVRNLKMEVDDSVFATPAGYKKVAATELNAPFSK